MAQSDEDLQAVFLDRFRAARKRTEVTQVDLADALGVSQQTIAKMENGQQRIRLSEAQQLATAIGVPIERLLGFADQGESTERLLERLGDERHGEYLARSTIPAMDQDLVELQEQLRGVLAQIESYRHTRWWLNNELAIRVANITSIEQELARRGVVVEGEASSGEHQEA